MAGLGEKFSRHAQGLSSLGSSVNSVVSTAAVTTSVTAAQSAHAVALAMGDHRPMLTEILLTQIEPDPNQPRRDLGDLTELTASIQEIGLVQPIIVSVVAYERFRILAGERRFTAAGKAGLAKVPAIVRSLEEHQRLEFQLVENLHRKDLTPFEEAMSYRRLCTEFGLSHSELGKRLGKTQVSVTETLQVLNLPPQIQQEALALEVAGGRPIGKSLLLEIVRRPPSEQPRLWDAAKRGELTVKKVRAERDVLKKALMKNSQLRAFKPFRYPIALVQNNASVTIEFLGGNPCLEDVVSALEEALTLEQARITR